MFLEMLKTEIFWAMAIAISLIGLFLHIIKKGLKQIHQEKAKQKAQKLLF